MKLACYELIVLLNIYRGKFVLAVTPNAVSILRTLVKEELITFCDDDHWIITAKGYEHINKALEVI